VIPTDELWRRCVERSKAVHWSNRRSWAMLDDNDMTSAAHMAFMEACEKWERSRKPFLQYFELRYCNKLRAMRRRCAVRNRLLPRDKQYDVRKTHSKPVPKWSHLEFMKELDANERKLVEMVLDFDQRFIQSKRRREGSWPVQRIMAMARHQMGVMGWDKRKQRRVIEGVKTALIESLRSA